jgi:hypothetical protein
VSEPHESAFVGSSARVPWGMQRSRRHCSGSGWRRWRQWRRRRSGDREARLARSNVNQPVRLGSSTATTRMSVVPASET